MPYKHRFAGWNHKLEGWSRARRKSIDWAERERQTKSGLEAQGLCIGRDAVTTDKQPFLEFVLTDIGRGWESRRLRMYTTLGNPYYTEVQGPKSGLGLQSAARGLAKKTFFWHAQYKINDRIIWRGRMWALRRMRESETIEGATDIKSSVTIRAGIIASLLQQVLRQFTAVEDQRSRRSLAPQLRADKLVSSPKHWQGACVQKLFSH